MKTEVEIRYNEGSLNAEQIHARGASEFGAAWLSANMAAAEWGRRHIDVSHPAAREMLSFVALRILMRLRTDGHIQPKDKP